MENNRENVKLKYAIHDYSSYSASYLPENIMVDDPSDPQSRWFTDSETPSQFIMLRLESPAIVETIKFGKYKKNHVSDLRSFQIYGGLEQNNLSLLLTSGLKKDNIAETFELRHRTQEGLYLPVKYIKVVPLLSWGPAYNFTIWYIELQGKIRMDLISNALDTIYLRKEEEAVRLILKHLRRRRYKDAFEALSRESGVQLEGPVQSRLWNALVENGDYKLAEQILEEAMREGEFKWYMSWQPYTPVWRQMSTCSDCVEAELFGYAATGPDQAATDTDRPEELPPAPNGVEEPPAGVNGHAHHHNTCHSKPGPRGGHQLVVDSTTGTLYLFGGWNGTEDLDDLWAFDTRTERWALLSQHAALEGGPVPRSCHKMVLDAPRRRLYTLGRYLDNVQRVPANMNSDMFMYNIETSKWSLLCEDTAAVGGPRLVFDHQMCIDQDTQTIYVFGGRVLPANTEESTQPQYSGLYAYYAATGTWQQLLADQHDLCAPQPRVSHSMLFHPVQRRLYIFAGQRNKEHLLDLWWWDVQTGQSGALCSAAAACPPVAGFTQRATLDPDSDEMFVLSKRLYGPERSPMLRGRRLSAACPPVAGFTQRATLDPDSDEMFVLSGMSKEKDRRVHNTLWVFSLSRVAWTCVYRNERVTPDEPRPRFAHQLVYDPVKKIHYLFGGNPGIQTSPRIRLDDLWALQLQRPSPESLLRDLLAKLREACFRELCDEGKEVTALEYLRNDVRKALDLNDPEQASRFHRLASVLFCTDPAERVSLALSPRRSRALLARKAESRPPKDLAKDLAAVLGAEDSGFETSSEASQPFEEIAGPQVDTWDVGVDEDCSPPTPAWRRRSARLQIYDDICQYFRPSVVPPQKEVSELVQL